VRQTAAPPADRALGFSEMTPAAAETTPAPAPPPARGNAKQKTKTKVQ